MSAAEKLGLAVRALVEDDYAFILSSWKKSYRDAVVPKVPAHIYFPHMHNRIEGLKVRGAEFRIACDPDDTNFIFGWACHEGPLVHYVYVRQSRRSLGIATHLLEDVTKQPVHVTHWTHTAERIAARRPGLLVYQPNKLDKL